MLLGEQAQPPPKARQRDLHPSLTLIPPPPPPPPPPRSRPLLPMKISAASQEMKLTPSLTPLRASLSSLISKLRVPQVALKQRRLRAPSEQVRSLWHHARGLDNQRSTWQPVKASRVTMAYTGHEALAPFAAQGRPPMFPLDDSCCRRDETMQAQQTRPGAAAHALCSAMAMLNDCTVKLQNVLPPSSSSKPDPAEEILQYLCADVATALGHSLRVLAAEHSMLCRDRRTICLNTVSDNQGRAALEKLPPSDTALFSGDLDSVVNAIKNRREVRGAFKAPNQSFPRSAVKGHRRPFYLRSQRPRRDPGTGERGAEPTPVHQGRLDQPFRPQPYGAFCRGRGRGLGKTSGHKYTAGRQA